MSALGAFLTCGNNESYMYDEHIYKLYIYSILSGYLVWMVEYRQDKCEQCKHIYTFKFT